MLKNFLFTGGAIAFAALAMGQSNTARDLTYQNISGNSVVFATTPSPGGYVRTRTTPLDDGKILVSGYFYWYPHLNPHVKSLMRVHNDGSIDTTFNYGGDTYIIRTEPTTGGKYFAVKPTELVRLNHDGSLDNTFNIEQSDLRLVGRDGFAVQPDGKVLIANGAQSGNPDYKYLVRLLPDGSLDHGFNTNVYNALVTTGINPAPLAVTLLDDGKVVICNTNGLIYCFNPDGTLAWDFSGLPSGYWNNRGTLRQVLAYPGGKVLLVTKPGSANSNNFSLLRLNNDGTLDGTFNNDISGAMHLYAQATVSPDGKIYLCGTDEIEGHSSRGLARLTADGHFDGTFDVGTGFGNYLTNPVFHLSVQSDGKLLVSNYTGEYQGGSLQAALDGQFVIRLNSDGDSSVGVPEAPSLSGFALYPNPATDHITLTEVPLGAQVRIMDLTGKVVHATTIRGERHTVQTGHLPRGLYFVALEDHGRTLTRKFMVAE